VIQEKTAMARDASVPSLRALLDRQDVTPSLVLSIQTFGCYDANVHPHVDNPIAGGGS
jgi:hypothetical protein